MKKADDGELSKLFNAITTPVSGGDARLMDYVTFKEVVDQSLEKGFNSGHRAGVKQAEQLVREALQRIDPK